MKGKVYLVGAGPGDYKLLTLKGLECIRQADVLIYDRLVNEKYLQEASDACELIYVGKASNQHTLPQEEINNLIAQKAREGKIVTRLKGGDPYVFGRGGEEGEVLYEQGIDFEVIPGITSAIGGLCYAGIPITHRDHASSFHVMTGHLREDGQESEEINWNALAKVKGTLVFLMGVKNLQQISNNLIKEGKAIDTPVAFINWATRPNQRVVTTTLKDAYEVAIKENIKPPTLIVVGTVVNLRNTLNFFEKRPLFGKNIVVTRARTQSSQMVENIIEQGGNAIEVPTIKIEKILNNKKLEEEIKQLNLYQYLIFTSVNAVEIFFEKLTEMDLDCRALANLKIAAIGNQTAKFLKSKGIKADIMPKNYTLEALAEILQPLVKSTDNILMPKAKKTRDYLTENLNGTITEVPIYETVIDYSQKDRILNQLAEGQIDYLTFSSSSTVTNFIKLIGEENIAKLDHIKIVSIGPVTTKTILENKLKLYQEANEATIHGMLEILEADNRGV